MDCRAPFIRRSGRRLAITAAALAVSACNLDMLLQTPSSPSAPPDATPAGTAVARLVFAQTPVAGVAGAPLPAVEVAAVDQNGNVAMGFSGTVVLTLRADSGTLSGTLAREATDGVATFDDLTIDLVGAGYRFTASSDGLADVTSDAFDIGAGAPTFASIAAGDQQTDTVAATLTTAYRLRVTDAGGHPVRGVRVSWRVVTGGGTVTARGDVTGPDGTASATHTLGTVAGPQGVVAQAEGLGGAPLTFRATAKPGAPAKLAFTVQPQDVERTKSIKPPVQVTVQDRFDNPATTFDGSVTVSITPLTGTPGARLTGTLTRSFAAGVATFDNLKIDRTGLLYRLRASGNGRVADSAPFNVLNN